MSEQEVMEMKYEKGEIEEQKANISGWKAIKSILAGLRRRFSLALAILGSAATTSSSTISGSAIFSSIWGLIMNLAGDITNSLGNLISQIFSGFGQSIVEMFQSFGFSMAGYGVWAPVMFVIGLGAALLVGYILLDFIDAEKDVTGMENDL